jgi:hypothetical protein
MNIESAQYISHEGKVKTVKATIDGQVMFVPISEGNRHYAAIVEWTKEDGNEIAAAD